MNTVRLNVEEPMMSGWGEFAVRKTYIVSRGRRTVRVFGYVIQTVVKSTRVEVGDSTLTTSDEISEFTSGQVLNASETYSELFPILNGITCYGEETEDRSECIDDQFQNGAILKYELDEADGLFYANDEPPTRGSITMTGYNRFFPTDEATATDIVNRILSREGPLTLQGVNWSLDSNTPANGLPYNAEFRIDERASEATHSVVVTWGYDGETAVRSTLAMQGGSHRRRTYRKKKFRTQTRKRRQ